MPWETFPWRINTLCGNNFTRLPKCWIRATRLSCEMRLSFHPTSGWHLSTCVYPNKGDCSCWFLLSHPTFHFAREKARVSHVLNKGLHWGYCPLSKIACDELITLDTDKKFDCKCLVDLNPTIPQEYLKEKDTNDSAIASSHLKTRLFTKWH
ncbi:hypothetical protein AVEN_259272-1 [Araneus ventricosus]|uniref:Uncharacterized protein n=1 Tax=Araneus ventricosus TaxID=182803 RepID=A0A4Y2RRA0_ARAVE|nr:hypothetical protein AVEN_259272-1 [Araneus ventricosus]